MRRALVLLLAAGLLVGCGDDDAGGDNAVDRVAGAVKASANSTSFRMSFELASDLAGEEYTLEGTGVFAADGSRARMKGSTSFDGPSREFEMIAVGDDIYFSGPFAEALVGARAEWAHMTEGAPEAMQPREFLQFLRDSEQVEEVGREEIRGRSTVHLRGPVDVPELIDRAESSLGKQLALDPQARRVDMVVDVWIDEQDDRMWRIDARLTHPETEGELTLTADILEHDVSLEGIEAPPADDVAEAPTG